MATIPGGVYRPYGKLVRIKVLGREAEVPENNILLRGFQYLSPEMISCGRFCWNEDCQYCRVIITGLDGKEHKLLSCKLMVRDGLEVKWMDAELVRCLKTTLNL